MKAVMKIQKILLCSALLLAIGLCAGCGGFQASSQTAPPNIRPGVQFRGVTNGNVYGGGQYIVVGVVKEVKGNWVLTDNGTWVNFDTVVEFSISK